MNAIIQRHHPDTATLRRELADGRWLQREGGVYWRTEESAPEDVPTLARVVGESGVTWRIANRERGAT